MNRRDQAIIRMRERNLSYTDIGETVNLTRQMVYRIIKKYRPDLMGNRAPRRRYTRDQVEEVLRLRLAGMSKEHIRRLTGISWEIQQRIYQQQMPGLVNLWRQRDEEVIGLRRRKVTLIEIARLTGKSRSTVGDIIRRLAPELIKQGVPPVEEIIALRKQDMTQEAIGEIVGWHEATVRNIINRHAPELAGDIRRIK